MGEVYRATDTNLGREVAIKVLPEAFALDAERLARFQREAKTLASLNHPNIAIIHGLEKGDGVRALVMELVEGPTLADRIMQGAIPIEEALPVARQIAEALESAHEHGVVHRDLKPANIKVRPDGTAKVLDFGLAKAVEPVGTWSPSISESSTITTPAMTHAGVILGTAAYMSPEQARGKSVDKRSDIWAFGCVLFEMLTGKRAFYAEDVALTLAEVVKSEPDWAALPDLPPAVQLCLRQCFKKDPRQRLRDIGDMRLALEGAFDVDTLADGRGRSNTPGGRVPKWLLPFAAAAAVAAAVATLWLQRDAPPEVVRFEIHAPAGSKIPPGAPAISLDGRRLAYVVTGPDATDRIHVRNIDELESRALQGTEKAVHPFWSPDGRSLAFVSEGVLKHIDLEGGPPRPIAAQISAPWQGTWNQFGDLLCVVAGLGIVRVRTDGSKPVPVMRSTTNAGETGARFPFFLPDGRRFLLFIGSDGENAIHLASLDSADRTLVVKDVLSAPLLAPTPEGRTYLLYLQDETLVAQEFDPASGSVRSPASRRRQRNRKSGAAFLDAHRRCVAKRYAGVSDGWRCHARNVYVVQPHRSANG